LCGTGTTPGRLRKVRTRLSKLTLDDAEKSRLTWDDATPSVSI
jgi:hypothetical protein